MVATWGEKEGSCWVSRTPSIAIVLEVVADRVAEEVLTAYARFFAACTNICFTDFDRLPVCGLRYLAAG